MTQGFLDSFRATGDKSEFPTEFDPVENVPSGWENEPFVLFCEGNDLLDAIDKTGKSSNDESTGMSSDDFFQFVCNAGFRLGKSFLHGVGRIRKQ